MFPLSDSVKSRRFPFINFGLITLTVYVFYLQITAPSFENFILQYALIPANIDFSDFPTLTPFITSIFLHGSILHILSNMWFLWVFGDNVEGHLPPFVYLFLYFGAGIAGNIAQYLVMPDSPIPMLGASGAVAGALGAYFTLFPRHEIRTLVPLPLFIFPLIINISASVMLGYWFVLQFLSGAMSTGSEQGGIAFWAHVVGFVFGYLFVKIFPKRDPKFVEVE